MPLGLNNAILLVMLVYELIERSFQIWLNPAADFDGGLFYSSQKPRATMKLKNQLPCDEARLVNVAGQRPIEHLTNDALDHHLENIYVFKLGLLNSFGVDFRKHTFTCSDADGARQQVLFNYLSEVIPLVLPQANRMPKRRRFAYDKLAASAVDSFWEVYYRFQPLIHRAANQSGVDVDDLGNVLGRAILLYEKDRGFTFYSYFEKTLRESIKNLRGKQYAEEYRLPLSAGRLVPQLLWLIDQETLRLQRAMTNEESDTLLIGFLQKHKAKFSESMMRIIARTISLATRSRAASIDQCTSADSESSFAGSIADHHSVAHHDSIESRDEHEHLLRQIHNAITKAGFSEREQAIVLQRLDLAHDQSLYERIEAELTTGSLRNRKSQLMVRFMAAMHYDQAKRFGKFLLADPQSSKPMMYRSLQDLVAEFIIAHPLIGSRILNEMSLSESAFRLTIAERGRLESFLLEHPMCRNTKISGHLYNKLKAALMDQDRQAFPCVRRFIAD